MESVTIPKRRSKSSNSGDHSYSTCDNYSLNASHKEILRKHKYKCCRTIILRKTDSYGFTLQTYAFKNYRTNKAELLTYVDYVEVGGSAHRAGLRRGDVILEINGVSIENFQHEQLVHLIRHSAGPLRIIVMLEDWCQKIDLNIRKFKLKQCLKEKYHELESLEKQERKLLAKMGIEFDEPPACLSPNGIGFARVVGLSKDDIADQHEVDSVFSPDSGLSISLQDGRSERHSLQKTKNWSYAVRSLHRSNRHYECHSLPSAGKKKHIVENQVRSICAAEVKMESLSKSSVNLEDALDGASTSNSGGCSKFDAGVDKYSSRASPVWYSVPKMHRAALLKRQRKSPNVETTRWYFDAFADCLADHPDVFDTSSALSTSNSSNDSCANDPPPASRKTKVSSDVKREHSSVVSPRTESLFPPCNVFPQADLSVSEEAFNVSLEQSSFSRQSPPNKQKSANLGPRLHDSQILSTNITPMHLNQVSSELLCVPPSSHDRGQEEDDREEEESFPEDQPNSLISDWVSLKDIHVFVSDCTLDTKL